MNKHISLTHTYDGVRTSIDANLKPAWLNGMMDQALEAVIHPISPKHKQMAMAEVIRLRGIPNVH